MKKIVVSLFALSVLFGFTGVSEQGTALSAAEDSSAALVAPVTFSKPGGFCQTPFILKLSTVTKGAVIYYDLKGAPNEETSNRYDKKGIYINKQTSVYAMAVDKKGNKSEVVKMTYSFLDTNVGIIAKGELFPITKDSFMMSSLSKKLRLLALYIDNNARLKKVPFKVVEQGSNFFMSTSASVKLYDQRLYKKECKTQFTDDIIHELQAPLVITVAPLNTKDDEGAGLLVKFGAPKADSFVISADKQFVVLSVRYAGDKPAAWLEFRENDKMKKTAAPFVKENKWPEEASAFDKSTVRVFKLHKSFANIAGRVDLVIDNKSGMDGITLK